MNYNFTIIRTKFLRRKHKTIFFISEETFNFYLFITILHKKILYFISKLLILSQKQRER